jgi:hypothetical protein
MDRGACQNLTNSQASRAPDGPGKAPVWAWALRRLRCRGFTPPRDYALEREDALCEAAIALSLGDGLPFTGHEYRLLEQLRRIDP